MSELRAHFEFSPNSKDAETMSPDINSPSAIETSESCRLVFGQVIPIWNLQQRSWLARTLQLKRSVWKKKHTHTCEVMKDGLFS